MAFHPSSERRRALDGPAITPAAAKSSTTRCFRERDALHRFDPGARAALPSSPEDRSTARPAHKPRSPSAVLDLGAAREERRLRDYQTRLCSVIETNRKALARLFQSGLIFTRAGTRLGRDLLLGHQHLFRAAELLARVGELASHRGGRGRRDAETEALFAQIQALLARTSELSARSDGLLARQR